MPETLSIGKQSCCRHRCIARHRAGHRRSTGATRRGRRLRRPVFEKQAEETAAQVLP